MIIWLPPMMCTYSVEVNLVWSVTFAWVIVQGMPGCVPWGICLAFLNDYLAVDKGLGVFPATCMLTIFGVGAVTGGLAGGGIGQYIYNARRRNVALFMGGVF